MKRILLYYAEMVATYMGMLALIGLHGKHILDSFQMWNEWGLAKQVDFVVLTVVYSTVWVVVYIRFKRCEKRLVERCRSTPTLVRIAAKFKRHHAATEKLLARQPRQVLPRPAFVARRDNNVD